MRLGSERACSRGSAAHEFSCPRFEKIPSGTKEARKRILHAELRALIDAGLVVLVGAASPGVAEASEEVSDGAGKQRHGRIVTSAKGVVRLAARWVYLGEAVAERRAELFGKREVEKVNEAEQGLGDERAARIRCEVFSTIVHVVCDAVAVHGAQAKGPVRVAAADGRHGRDVDAPAERAPFGFRNV